MGTIIAVDTETTGLEWWDEDYAFLATVSDKEGDEYYLPEQFGKLHERIAAAEAVVFHNAPFDIHFLAKDPNFSLEWLLSLDVHDTSLLARIVVPDHEANYQYGLKHLSEILLGEDSSDQERELKSIMKELGLIERADQKNVGPGAYLHTFLSPKGRDPLLAYALKDTRLTLELFAVLMERANEHDLAGYALERDVLPHIVRMEDEGIEVDHGRALALHGEYTERSAQLREKIFTFTNREDFNPDSNDHAAELLISHGVPLTQKTDTGQIRVDKWALERFQDHPVVATLLDLRTATKFLSTYLDVLVSKDRVHPSIWQIGARTHRMSCSNPNMQNIPVRSGTAVRELMIPGADNAFVVCDYSSIELRVLAYYMNDPDFTELVQTGLFFEFMGGKIYGTDDQSKWRVSRSNLKNGTYAIIYGAGGPRIATTIGGGMTPEQGRALSRQIKDVLGPKYRKLEKRVKEAVGARGYVTLMGGTERRLYVPRDRSYTGLNYLIQGTAAVIMKRGIVNAGEALQGTTGRMVLPVHDELLVRCPQGDAENVRDLVVDALESATDRFELKSSSAICLASYAEAK